MSNDPVAGWNSFLVLGSLTASTEAADGSVQNVADGNTYDFWQPTELPAWIEVELGEAATANYVGLASHTLGTSHITVTVQYHDGADWVDILEVTPADNRTWGAVFDEVTATRFRLYFEEAVGETAEIPVLGVAHIGNGLVFERHIYQGHTPITLAPQTEIRPNTSEGGQFLGRSIIRRGSATSVKVTNLLPAFVRSDDTEAFIRYAVRGAWFWFWRPEDYPGDVAYVWTVSEISRTNSGPADYMSMSFNLMGYVSPD